MCYFFFVFFFFFSSRRRHTRWPRDWSSDVCSSDLGYVVHVDATGGNIGGNQYGYAAIGESLQSGAASVLSLIAVQTHSENASASKLFRLSVHAVLSAHEHDGLAIASTDADDYLIAVLALADIKEIVLHCIDRSLNRRGGMRDGVMHEAVN